MRLRQYQQWSMRTSAGHIRCSAMTYAAPPMTEYIQQAPVEYVPQAPMTYAAPPVTEYIQQAPVEDTQQAPDTYAAPATYAAPPVTCAAPPSQSTSSRPQLNTFNVRLPLCSASHLRGSCHIRSTCHICSACHLCSACHIRSGTVPGSHFSEPCTLFCFVQFSSFLYSTLHHLCIQSEGTHMIARSLRRVTRTFC